MIPLRTWYELSEEDRRLLLEELEREVLREPRPVFYDGNLSADRAAKVFVDRGVVVPIDEISGWWTKVVGNRASTVDLLDACRLVTAPMTPAELRRRADAMWELYQ